jgi:hypothetical protein
MPGKIYRHPMAMVERNHHIFWMCAMGAPIQMVADKFDITRQRVYQIFRKEQRRRQNGQSRP